MTGKTGTRREIRAKSRLLATKLEMPSRVSSTEGVTAREGAIVASVLDESLNVIYGLSCSCHPEKGIRYVGQTRHGARGRLLSHRRAAKAGVATPVYKWIRKHGPMSIVAEVLEDCGDNQLLLNFREEYWISEFRENAGEKLLNVRPGGENSPLAESSKRKIGAKAKGRRPTLDTRGKMSASRLKYLESHPHPSLGRKMSREQLASHVIRSTGKANGFYGKKHSPETMARILAHRPDMTGTRNPFYGKTHTPAAIAKIIAANLGRPQSEHERLGKSLASRGQRNPATNLTDDEVIEIHRIYCQGRYTQTQIGMMFGVSQVVVSGIARGATWKYLGLRPKRTNCGRKKKAA